MFSKGHIYEHYRTVRWNVTNPEKEIEDFKIKASSFINELSVPGLKCFREPIHIGGAIFGREKVDSIITTFEESPLYAVSFGIAFGDCSVWLTTLRCASNLAGGSRSNIVHELLLDARNRSLKSLADVDFIDSTYEKMYLVATE